MYFLSKFHLHILALFIEKKVRSHQAGSGKEKKQILKEKHRARQMICFGKVLNKM